MLIFSSSFLNVSAADGTDNIDVKTDMTLKGEIWYEDSSDSVDVTTQMAFSNYNDYYRISFPLFNPNIDKSRVLVGLTLTDLFDFNTEHEYSLSFSWGTHFSLGMHCYVSLVYYDSSGKVLKEQDLVNDYAPDNTSFHSVDVSFKPDISGISSAYKCDLRIYFMQLGSDNSTARQGVYISKNIELIDKDDNSGWFQKIINKIEETISNIKLIPEKINNKLSELKDGIGGFFSDMWNKLQSAFSDIGNWFQELGNKIGGFFAELSEDIIEGLKSLFIPPEDYFDSRLDAFEELYVSHFGIFAQVQVFFEDTLSYFENLLSDDYVFTFPEISFPINGEKYTLIDEQTVDMSLWLSGDSWSSRLYKIYRLCASAILVFAVLQYASKVEHTVLGINNYDFIRM